MSFEIEFGFLVKPVAISGSLFEINPLQSHSELVGDVHERTHPDGFFYPPASHTIAERLTADGIAEEKVPRSERPALKFWLPASHTLVIHAPSDPEPLTGDAAFLVQATAYLFGTRLQLDEWAFESRVPLEYSTHEVVVTPRRAKRFLEAAYRRWLQENGDLRLRMTNILFMHSKAPCYEWTWEQYLVEYLVTDALYKWLVDATLIYPVQQHADRIREMSRVGVDLPQDPSVIDAIVAARNELFHEAFWEGERPGFRVSGERYTCLSRLRQFNQRVIAATLGGPTEYSRSAWTDNSQYMFFE